MYLYLLNFQMNTLEILLYYIYEIRCNHNWKKIDKKTHLYKNKYLTFHLGCEQSWKKRVKSELWLKNIEISKKI